MKLTATDKARLLRGWPLTIHHDNGVTERIVTFKDGRVASEVSMYNREFVEVIWMASSRVADYAHSNRGEQRALEFYNKWGNDAKAK